MEKDCLNEISEILYQVTPRGAKKTTFFLENGYESICTTKSFTYINKYNEKKGFLVGNEFNAMLSNFFLKLRDFHLIIRNEILHKLQFILDLENNKYRVNLTFMPNPKKD